MKEKLQEKKNLYIVCILVVVLVFIFMLLTKNMRLENNLKSIGKDFYSDYYARIEKNKDEENLKSFLSDFQNIGIKVSLESLERNNFKGNEKKLKKLSGCDKSKTIVTIYPQKPYGKKDYKIKVKLSCKK